jgi:hypothetical protein
MYGELEDGVGVVVIRFTVGLLSRKGLEEVGEITESLRMSSVSSKIRSE